MGKSCSFGLQHVLFEFVFFVILVVSNSGINGGTVVLIAAVPGHCLPLLFRGDLTQNKTDPRAMTCTTFKPTALQ